MKIPILNLLSEIEQHGDHYLQAIREVVLSGQFILGKNLELFEQEAAKFLGVKHAVGMNSGTDALIIGLRSLGVQPGDEVIVPSFTFYATAEAVSLIGAKPIFCEVEAATFNLDTDHARKLITDKTKVIIPVHLFGLCASMTAIRDLAKQHDLKILEDAAQAFGAASHGKTAGSFGEAAAFSFFPTKNLGAFGDGGMLVTSDDRVAEMARRLRHHGQKARYQYEELGYASRLDEIQAAILRVKLTHVADWNRKRLNAARRYSDMLRGISGIVAPVEPINELHIFHQYTIRVLDGKRDSVKDRLEKQGIGSAVYYPIPVHQAPVYLPDNVSLPLTERLCTEVLSLPIWPGIEPQSQAEVVEGLKRSLL